MGPCRNVTTRLWDFLQDRRGANAVEFALLAPVLFLLFLGITYSAFYLGVSHSLAQIAADAARYAMVGISQEERGRLAGEWVHDSASAYSLLNPDLVSFRTREVGSALEVAVEYEMTFVPQPPLLGHVVEFPARLSRTTAVLVP